MRRTLTTALMLTAAVAPWSAAQGDDDFDDFLKSTQKEFEEFAKTNEKEFEDFRKKINEEMLEFMKNPWMEVRPQKPVPKPVEPKPVVIDYDGEDEEEEEAKPTPKPAPKPAPIKTVVTPPKPKPQPQPVAPVKPVKKDDVKTADILLYGTAFKVAVPSLPRLTLTGQLSDKAIQHQFSLLVKADTDPILKSCLDARAAHRLCDWAYIRLLEKVAQSYYGKDTNESRLMWSYLMQQSGYGIRFAHDGSRFVPLFACDDIIYNYSWFTVGGRRFFNIFEPGKQLYICDFKYPGEQAATLAMSDLPLLAERPTPPRAITVHSYPAIKLSVSTNKNLIDFYQDYPTGTLGTDTYSRWAIYGNVPASPALKAIYPTLRKEISGKSQMGAASILLKVAQTFPYGFDDEIWGDDRAFFPDETWFYPKSDCEDHAIHFSRLVRDLMGLDVALVYYPGHLSAAVAFTDGSVNGNYVMHNGKKFTFCDATYFYAPVGQSAPSNTNDSAILIDLRK